jgi:hypothetical protein
MAFFNRWVMTTARRLASDPRVREKAVEIFHKEVQPRAAETWQKTKPKVVAAARDVREIARKTDARNNPGAFAALLKRRFIDGNGSR